jgi:hypothetical protein
MNTMSELAMLYNGKYAVKRLIRFGNAPRFRFLQTLEPGLELFYSKSLK